MLTNNILLIGYLGLYIILYLLRATKKSNFSPLSIMNFLLIYFAFSAFSSFVYYNVISIFISKYDDLTLPPFIYLAVCNIVAFIPFFKYENNEPSLIISDRQMKVLDKIAILLAICAILPFIETVFQIPKALVSSEGLAEIYEEKLEGAEVENYMSFISRKFFYIILILDYFTAPLLFVQMTKKVVNKKIVIGLILCLVTLWAYNMIRGGRSTMVQSILYTIVCYLLYRKHISDSVNKRIVYYGTVIISVGAVALMAVTLSRFIARDSSVYNNPFEWMALYFGEGNLNFNVDMWNVADKTSGGFKTIPLIMSIFEGHMITVPEIWAAGDSLGIPGNYYYTWIGQIYSDWNVFLTPVIIVFLTSIFSKQVSSSGYISIVSLLVLGLWAKVMVLSPFFFALSGTTNQLYILIFLFICYFIIKKW